MGIQKFIKDKLVKEPNRSYIKHGLMDEDQEYTREVRNMALEQIVDKHIASDAFQKQLGEFVADKETEALNK